MTDYPAIPGPPPSYVADGLQYRSGPTATEPMGLSPWQRRWNMKWLNEAYIPYMRRNDLHMERWLRRDTSSRPGEETRPGTEQFMLNGIEAGVANPRSSITRKRLPPGTHHLTWPVRMLASDTKRLWGRWRKHRENAMSWQMVVVMEEHGDTPR
ncbi:hypothetical protein GGR55DRAFT_651140 [Xylaria sp. FL0064]|nr:hypothetical protein GGR55DRAFT_651140 [Xylaria sp. FL0064]